MAGGSRFARAQFVRSGAGTSGVDQWVADVAYTAGAVRTYAGKQWLATATVPRGLQPHGVGDGSTADRDLLLAQLNGYARQAGVTGGYAGATYVVDTTTGTTGSLTGGLYGGGHGSLPFALTQSAPLWIVFDKTVFPLGSRTPLTFTAQIIPLPNKTVDGRGAGVWIKGGNSIQIAGINIAGGTGTLRYTSGVANIVWTFFDIDVTTTNLNRDCFTLAQAFDLVAFHHVGMTGGTDAVIDMTRPAGNVDLTTAQGGDGVGPNLFNTDPTLQPYSRVSLSWCKLGPHPTRANLDNQGALSGDGNANVPEQGKTSLQGLHKDNYGHGMSDWDHCIIDGGVQRNPKWWQGFHGHFRNSVVKRYGMSPGIIPPITARFTQAQQDAAVAAYTAAGFTTVVDGAGTKASYGSTGLQSERDPQDAGSEGVVLVENSIFVPYRNGVDNHVIPFADGRAWPILYDAASAFPAIECGNNPGFLKTSGIYLKYGAVRDGDNHPENVPARPYSYSLYTADDVLQAEVELGAGNYQPWTLIG